MHTIHRKEAKLERHSTSFTSMSFDSSYHIRHVVSTQLTPLKKKAASEDEATQSGNTTSFLILQITVATVRNCSLSPSHIIVPTVTGIKERGLATITTRR
eukprot:TRINITY_DN22396_c0_g1_i1.p1 TRINITY_DN22396_c0_g1~~TRINITY_DN22396_c0_g1_i1.p1  ORF type:complete len:100 (-),score=1.96 TRINITY_DN22396_c0_g1_i1:213-512(-)